MAAVQPAQPVPIMMTFSMDLKDGGIIEDRE